MDLQLFQKHFYTELNEITNSLSSLTNNSEDTRLNLSIQYESVSNRIELLKKYFTEQTSFIPNYEIRKAQDHLTKLNNLAQQKRDELFPKKKFGFKSKQNMTSLETAIQKHQQHSTNTESKKIEHDSININFENSCMIKDLLDNNNYIKFENEINQKDLAIVNVKNSFIQLIGNPSVVHMSHIENCTILCGPITGSAFINNCVDSNIVIASHQLRIHETKNTNFYIHVASRAIIENCNQVTFSPYSWKYPELEQHFDSSNLFKQDKNINWQSIDDFNWLNQEQKSPNWSFLDVEKRSSWTSNQNGVILN